VVHTGSEKTTAQKADLIAASRAIAERTLELSRSSLSTTRAYLRSVQGTLRNIERTRRLLEASDAQSQRFPLARLSPKTGRSRISKLLVAAQERERQRIARELHDDVLQRLAAISLGLGFLGTDRKTPAVVRSTLSDIQNELGILIRDIQTLSHALYPSIVHELGLAAALRQLCAKSSRFDQIDYDIEQLPAYFPEGLAAAFYRIAQESVRNAIKYAAGARISMTVQIVRGILRMVIRDEGPGFDQSQARGRGLGLVSMRERAKESGISLTIQSKPGRGTTIIAQATV